ncbi:Uncharacterised protein [Enterobacter hormaechei]|nr:Uncharacterised protein [Enterobacter hormaechei]
MRINCSITLTERAQLSYMIDAVNSQRAALNLPPVNQTDVIQEIIHRVSEMSSVNLCNVFISRAPKGDQMTDYHARMTEQVRELFPELHDRQVTNMANSIGSELRKRHNDQYRVELSRQPYEPDSGSHGEFMIVACGHMVYVRILMD